MIKVLIFSDGFKSEFRMFLRAEKKRNIKLGKIGSKTLVLQPSALFKGKGNNERLFTRTAIYNETLS